MKVHCLSTVVTWPKIVDMMLPDPVSAMAVSVVGPWALMSGLGLSVALPEPAMLGLKALAAAADNQFSFGDALWVRIVYDFAVAYHRRVMDRGHLLQSLTPIYLAWVASFILQVQEAGPTEVEERLERLCLTYETEKTYLISRWK